MTKKQKYISAFLDGYFIKSKLEYNFKYFEQLEEAEKLAKEKWKRYKKQKI